MGLILAKNVKRIDMSKFDNIDAINDNCKNAVYDKPNDADMDDIITAILTNNPNVFISWDSEESVIDCANRIGYFDRHPDMRKFIDQWLGDRYV